MKSNIYMLFGVSYLSELADGISARENRIREEWERSKTMPRKKKKRVRKGLLLDMSMCAFGKTLLPMDLFRPFHENNQ